MCAPDEVPAALVTLAQVEPNQGRTARKVMSVADDGTPAQADYNLGRLFVLAHRRVEGHDSLVALARELEDDSDRVLLRGEAIDPDPEQLQVRRWHARPDQPATLRDAPSRLFVGDIDKLPNTRGLDPRIDPQGAAAWILASLGPEFERCAAVVVFSGSCCVDLPEGTVPDTLNARVLAFMSEALDHAAIKRLMTAMELRLLQSIPEDMHPPRGKRIIDWSVTMPMQPTYLARPLFRQGRRDPFEGRSRVVSLTAGRSPCLDVAALREAVGELVPASRRSDRAGKLVPKNKASVAMPAPPPRPALPLPELPRPALHPDLAAMCREAVSERAARGRTGKGKGSRPKGLNRANLRVGYARAAVEALRLLHARVEWGAAFPAFAPYAMAGGAPQGQRDKWAFVASALVGAAASTEDIDSGRLDGIVEWIAALAGGHAWMGREFRGKGMDGALLARCRDAAMGKTVEWNGKRVDPRYCYRFDTVIDLLDVGVDEALALGLISLAPEEWIASHNRRRREAREAGREYRTDLERAIEREELRRKISRLPRDRRSPSAIRDWLARQGIELSLSAIRDLKNVDGIAHRKVDFVLAGIGFQGGAPSRSRSTLAGEKKKRGRAFVGSRSGAADLIAAFAPPQGEVLPTPEGMGEAASGIHVRPAEAAGCSPVEGLAKGEAGLPSAATSGAAEGQPDREEVAEASQSPAVSADTPGDDAQAPLVAGSRLVVLSDLDRAILRRDDAATAAAVVAQLRAMAERAAGKPDFRLSLPVAIAWDHPAAAPIRAAWTALRPGAHPADAVLGAPVGGLVMNATRPMAHRPAGAPASVIGAWRRVSLAWDAAWTAMGGDDDAEVRDRIVAVLAATAKAIRARGALSHHAPADVLALPAGAIFDATHPLAGPILAAAEAVEAARRAVRLRERRKDGAWQRLAFTVGLRAMDDHEALRHVARRRQDVVGWIEEKISHLRAEASRDAGRAVRMRDIPKAMELNRAMAAILRADRKALTAAGLPVDLDARCRVLLWPVMSDERRAELHRLLRDEAPPSPPLKQPAAATRLPPPPMRPSFLRPRVAPAVSAAHVVARHVPHFMSTSAVAAPSVD